MKLARTGAIALSIVMALGWSTPAFAANPDQVGVPTLGDSSTMTELVYEDGTVVTMTYTNVGSGVPTSTTPTVMDANEYWGGFGDLSTAFTPGSLVGGEGLTIGWNTFDDRDTIGCLPSTDTNNPQRPDYTQYPATPNPYVCSTPATVTFTFSRPVTDAIFNLHNLAGGWYNAKASFYSSWKLSDDRTPGLTAELVSHAGNFQVTNGDTIETIQPPGTGITNDVWAIDPRENPTGDPINSTPLDVAPQGSRTYFGSGSGAVVIKGTYSQVSFDVTLARYTNTERLPSYFWDYIAYEHVMLNWNVPPVNSPSASDGSSLPSTGVDLGQFELLSGIALFSLLTGLIIVLRRRGNPFVM